MERSRQIAPLAGIVACLFVLGTLVVPYLLTDSTTASLYYDSGLLHPLVAGLLAVVSIVVFAAGREERTDPALAAGVVLTFGLFMVFLVLAWALTVRMDVAGPELADHRWALVGMTLSVLATAAWYARSLGLL
jgi:hypothetical protein